MFPPFRVGENILMFVLGGASKLPSNRKPRYPNNMSVDFKGEIAIKRWLRTQSRDVICVFSARAALRAVPCFAQLMKNMRIDRSTEAIMLPSLWAIATALSAGIWPDRAVELNAASAASAAADADADAATYAATYAAAAAACCCCC